MGIYKKLMEVQTALHAQKLEKTGNNNGRPFFELSDFLPYALALFAQKGLCGVPSFSLEKATLTIVDTEDETQRIVIESPFGSAALKGCHEVQNIGAVETYQRRYLWMAALNIIETDGLEAMPATDAEALTYLDGIAAATTMEELNAAVAKAEEATRGNRDKSVKDAITKVRQEAGKKIQKNTPLPEDRFDKGVAAYIAGKIPIDKLKEHPLTDRQKSIIEKLERGEA